VPAAFRFVDLFAGVGGFHHALGAKGFEGRCDLAVEIDPYCRDVYSEAFKATPLRNDIRSITRRREVDGSSRDATPDEIREMVPEHEVLCAGFPCQPFSKSGAQLGLRDQTRGTLFFDIMEIVRARTPQFLILENVPNLVGPRHTDTWRLMIAAIREAGYRVSSTPVVISPHRIPPPLGSPQVRDRVFILASHDPGRARLEVEPLAHKNSEEYWSPRQWRLEGYFEPEDPGPAYAIRDVERTWLNAWEAFVKGIEDDHLPGFPMWVDAWAEMARYEPDTPSWKVDFVEKNAAFYRTHRGFLDGWLEETWDEQGTTVRGFPLSRRKFEWQARSVHPTRAGRTIWDLLIHLRPSGIRVKPADYFPALVAITQTSIVGELQRRITPREAARLQGIPFQPFILAGLPDPEIYKQLGNAVNVGVVQYLASLLFASAGLRWGSAIQLEFPRLSA
jgi:DNA (cytosine-5)-methyltransferase 1